jgi:hypothetical protein
MVPIGSGPSPVAPHEYYAYYGHKDFVHPRVPWNVIGSTSLSTTVPSNDFVLSGGSRTSRSMGDIEDWRITFVCRAQRQRGAAPQGGGGPSKASAFWSASRMADRSSSPEYLDHFASRAGVATSCACAQPRPSTSQRERGRGRGSRAHPAGWPVGEQGFFAFRRSLRPWRTGGLSKNSVDYRRARLRLSLPGFRRAWTRSRTRCGSTR